MTSDDVAWLNRQISLIDIVTIDVRWLNTNIVVVFIIVIVIVIVVVFILLLLIDWFFVELLFFLRLFLSFRLWWSCCCRCRCSNRFFLLFLLFVLYLFHEFKIYQLLINSYRYFCSIIITTVANDFSRCQFKQRIEFSQSSINSTMIDMSRIRNIPNEFFFHSYLSTRIRHTY